MSIAYLLCEALKDISTENKLYHRTNIESFVQIVKTGGLSGYNYGKRRAIDKGNSEEIATGRKSTFTTIDKVKNFSDLSGSIGNLEFILFIDRIKASARNNKVVPVAEFNITNKKDVIENLEPLIVTEYTTSIEKIANLLIKNKIELLSGSEKVKKIMDFIDKNFPNATKKVVTPSRWESVLYVLSSQAYQEPKAREGEERINLPEGKNIPLNQLLMQIKILPSFKIDFKDYADAFVSQKQLKDLLEAIKNPIVLKDATYNRMVNYIHQAIKVLSERGVNKLLDYYNVDKEDKKHILFSTKLKEKNN